MMLMSPKSFHILALVGWNIYGRISTQIDVCLTKAYKQRTQAYLLAKQLSLRTCLWRLRVMNTSNSNQWPKFCILASKFYDLPIQMHSNGQVNLFNQIWSWTLSQCLRQNFFSKKLHPLFSSHATLHRQNFSFHFHPISSTGKQHLVLQFCAALVDKHLIYLFPISCSHSVRVQAKYRPTDSK